MYRGQKFYLQDLKMNITFHSSKEICFFNLKEDGLSF